MKRTVPQYVVAPWTAACLALAVFAPGDAVFAKGLAATVASASVAGVVCDASGTPQMGIVVDLLRADSTLVARAFTDGKGNYSIARVLPGQYALKAVGGSFSPTLKQNLRIRPNTVVNLTLSSVYDLMQFVPQPRRARPGRDDDWAWTLRTAQSRPLLRWLEDGSPVLVWDGANETRRGPRARRLTRVQAVTGQKRFGSGGQQVSMALVGDASARRRLAFSAGFAPDAAKPGFGPIEALMGFRQEMAASGLGTSSVQTLAAVALDPEASAGGQQGLEAAAMRTWESLQLVNALEAEAGSDQVLARVGDGREILAALPFASVTLHHGQSALEYRVATARDSDPDADEATAWRWMPVLSERAGSLELEHGLHQKLGWTTSWSTSAGPGEMQVILYSDNLENPAIEASGRLSAAEQSGQWMLEDGASGLLRAAGPKYATAGMLASVESRLPGNNRVRLTYANGDALVMPAAGKPEEVAAILEGVHPRRAQMYAIALSGTAEGLGTRWRASYRSQPESTVTAVAPFAVDASSPYLNLSLRQPFRLCRQGPGGMEAQIDLSNLLAQGYRPFLTSDGSRIYFAQAQRTIRGGLAFTF